MQVLDQFRLRRHFVCVGCLRVEWVRDWNCRSSQVNKIDTIRQVKGAGGVGVGFSQLHLVVVKSGYESVVTKLSDGE